MQDLAENIGNNQFSSMGSPKTNNLNKNLFNSNPCRPEKLDFFQTPERKNITPFSANNYPKTDFIPSKRPSLVQNMFSHFSPQREIVGDRFIPVRSESNISRNLFGVNDNQLCSPDKNQAFDEETQNQIKYNNLLENQLLDVKPHNNLFSNLSANKNNSASTDYTNKFKFGNNQTPASGQKNIFSSPTSQKSQPTTPIMNKPKLLQFHAPIQERSNKDQLFPNVSPFAGIEEENNGVLQDLKAYRKISKIPYRILDAPGLVDDFYLNVIHWSEKNYVAVSLLHSVWVWDEEKGKVGKFCERPTNDNDDYTAVQWDPKGNMLAMGDGAGVCQIWDHQSGKLVRSYHNHSDRIDCLSWNGSNLLSSGSRDGYIMTYDVRTPDQVMCFKGHKDEVCGLKWSPDGSQLASGANDNKVMIWSLRKTEPEAKFSEHKSAIKAIAWSPHQQNLLLTAGGYSDRTIKAWNTLSMSLVQEVETDSQVCNIIFSKNSNEFVTAHGHYTNHLVVWKYPEMMKLSVIDGEHSHGDRVLFLADSPDGEKVVSGSCDETLKFWNIFPPKPQQKESFLFPSIINLR